MTPSMLIMIARAFSLLLVVGLLLPPLPLCLSLDLSGDCATGPSCCCVESDVAPAVGPTVSSAMPGSGRCPCELSAPQTRRDLQAPASSESSEVAAPFLALAAQDPNPVALVDWSDTQPIDSGPPADVRTRPLRVTAGVRLI